MRAEEEEKPQIRSSLVVRTWEHPLMALSITFLLCKILPLIQSRSKNKVK